MEKVTGLGSTNWPSQNIHGDVEHSTGHTVTDSVIAMYGVRWVPDLWKGSL